MEWPRIDVATLETLRARVSCADDGHDCDPMDFPACAFRWLLSQVETGEPKLVARLEAAELLAEEVRRAPCRDDSGHTRCLRCAALAAWEASK
jgi:hypothetical protein